MAMSLNICNVTMTHDNQLMQSMFTPQWFYKAYDKCNSISLKEGILFFSKNSCSNSILKAHILILHLTCIRPSLAVSLLLQLALCPSLDLDCNISFAWFILQNTAHDAGGKEGWRRMRCSFHKVSFVDIRDGTVSTLASLTELVGLQTQLQEWTLYPPPED